GGTVVRYVEPGPYSPAVRWVVVDGLLTTRGEIFPHFNPRHDPPHDGRWGNVVTVNGRTREQLFVKAGERIRLRLLNVANGRVFKPDFSGLDAKVIAVDGMYAARPVDPVGFELAPGNRLDLDITVAADRGGQRVVVVDRFMQRPIPLAQLVVTNEAVAQPDF